MNLFRRKSVTDLQAEALTDQSLHRALGPVNLTALGVGAIIGTGIFVLTGTVAAQNAGPAVVLSFVLAGLASIFAALCYSEFASLVPMAGSAYTYGYATLGELFAWIIGWDLILEYAVGAITVAIGWSGYVVSFLHDFGIVVPPAACRRARHRIDRPARRAGCRSENEGRLDGLRHRPGRPDPGARHRPRHPVACHRHLQSARGPHHLRRHDAAGGRHQGVRQLQQRHCLRESRRRAALHRGRRPSHPCRQLASVHPRQRRPVRPLRLVGNHDRRGHRLLRLHRLRRRQHRRPGSQEPAARHAHRHHRLPADLHRALHPGLGALPPALCLTRNWTCRTRLPWPPTARAWAGWASSSSSAPSPACPR